MPRQVKSRNDHDHVHDPHPHSNTRTRRKFELVDDKKAAAVLPLTLSIRNVYILKFGQRLLEFLRISITIPTHNLNTYRHTQKLHLNTTITTTTTFQLIPISC